MPRLTRKHTAALLTFAACALAGALWAGLRPGDATPNASRPGLCEEWERADAAGQGLGWDLTYMSALKNAGLCPGSPLCGERAKPEPPIRKLFAEWQGDPIISSMEIELPGGHAGMAAIWLTRTIDRAHYWRFSLGEGSAGGRVPVSTQLYDNAFEAMACWRQHEPPLKVFGEKGYIGFLSLYKEGKSRQLLLTHNDLFEGDTDPDEGRPGRFWVVMLPLVRSVDARQKPPDTDRK